MSSFEIIRKNKIGNVLYLENNRLDGAVSFVERQLKTEYSFSGFQKINREITTEKTVSQIMSMYRKVIGNGVRDEQRFI